MPKKRLCQLNLKLVVDLSWASTEFNHYTEVSSFANCILHTMWTVFIVRRSYFPVADHQRPRLNGSAFLSMTSAIRVFGAVDNPDTTLPFTYHQKWVLRIPFGVEEALALAAPSDRGCKLEWPKVSVPQSVVSLTNYLRGWSTC